MVQIEYRHCDCYNHVLLLELLQVSRGGLNLYNVTTLYHSSKGLRSKMEASSKGGLPATELSTAAWLSTTSPHMAVLSTRNCWCVHLVIHS